MIKHPATSTKISYLLFTIIVALTVYSVNRLFGYIVIQQYKTLIDRPGIIEGFKTGDPLTLLHLQKTYHLEYETVKAGQIAKKTSSFLPDINPIMINSKPNPNVLPYNSRELLKQIRPNITVNMAGLFIVFPLVFDSNVHQYIVFYRLIP